jgi:hypothetical protein
VKRSYPVGNRPFNPYYESTPNFLRKSQNFFFLPARTAKNRAFYGKLGFKVEKPIFLRKYSQQPANSVKNSVMTHIRHQCQKPGFWPRLRIKTEIFVRNPVSLSVESRPKT